MFDWWSVCFVLAGVAAMGQQSSLCSLPPPPPRGQLWGIVGSWTAPGLPTGVGRQRLTLLQPPHMHAFARGSAACAWPRKPPTHWRPQEPQMPTLSSHSSACNGRASQQGQGARVPGRASSQPALPALPGTSCGPRDRAHRRSYCHGAATVVLLCACATGHPDLIDLCPKLLRPQHSRQRQAERRVWTAAHPASAASLASQLNCH